MQSPSTIKTPPATTFTPEGDQVEDVKRLESGVSDLMGPVVVGGRASADCFRYRGELQAGRGPDADDLLFGPLEPVKGPW